MGRSSRDDDAELGELIRFGTIAEVDLAAARCVVTAGGVSTGPVRWLQGRAGGTRHWSPPTVGEQALLICPEGDIAGGIALLGVSCTAFPPAGDQLREILAFADGAQISYDPEAHALAAHLPAGATVTIVADGGVAIQGDVAITGNVQVTGHVTASEDVVAGGISLKSHKHGGVQAGAAETGAPA
jgi:phage baseplate assembly protein V